MMTSFAATSLSAMRPSGEILDLVMPGILRVVAWGRMRGVWLPEFCRTGGLHHGDAISAWETNRESLVLSTHMRGDPGAVEEMLLAYGES